MVLNILTQSFAPASPKSGEKLFNAKNVHQTFALVFNLIEESFGADASGSTRLWILTHSVDLFVDLVSKADVAHALLKYSGLKASIVAIIGFLGGACNAEPAAKLLELLKMLCKVQVASKEGDTSSASAGHSVAVTSGAMILAGTFPRCAL